VLTAPLTLGLGRISSTHPQTAMLAQFMQATGMNEPFSRQCLDENSWNYDVAFNVYQQLKMQGAIPAAAYM